MSIPSVDIIYLLESLQSSSLGLAHKVNLFKGKEPVKPRDCVTVFDSDNYPDLALSDQGYERPVVQIRVRNTDYNTGLQLAYDIKNLLHGYHGTVNGTLYTVIRCSSGPALLDWMENGDARFIINFNLQRR